MSSRYRLTPAAVEDMEAIIDYLRERNPIAAMRFVEAAQATAVPWSATRKTR